VLEMLGSHFNFRMCKPFDRWTRAQQNQLCDGLDILYILFDPLIFEEEDEVGELDPVRRNADCSLSC